MRAGVLPAMLMLALTACSGTNLAIEYVSGDGAPPAQGGELADAGGGVVDAGADAADGGYWLYPKDTGTSPPTSDGAANSPDAGSDPDAASTPDAGPDAADAAKPVDADAPQDAGKDAAPDAGGGEPDAAMPPPACGTPIASLTWSDGTGYCQLANAGACPACAPIGWVCQGSTAMAGWPYYSLYPNLDLDGSTMSADPDGGIGFYAFCTPSTACATVYGHSYNTQCPPLPGGSSYAQPPSALSCSPYFNGSAFVPGAWNCP